MSDDDLIKAQVKWIAERIDRIDQKMDRLTERFNLTLGKMLGASAVAGLLASLAMEWMRR